MQYDNKMEHTHATVFDTLPDKPVPVYVELNGDWMEACRRAAILPRAEILVMDMTEASSMVVFSDDMGLHSGLWWRQTVEKLRKELRGY